MTEEVAAEFLRQLWALQEARGLRSRRLARMLGVTPSYLSHLQAGRRGKRLSLDFALRAVSLFPELGFVLSSELTARNTEVPAVTSEEETAP